MINHFARIGYGYIIDNEYREYPDPNDYETDQEFDEAVNEYFDYMDKIFDSEFCQSLNYGEEPTFFGIFLDSTSVSEPYVALDCPNCCELDEPFQRCYDEFCKFFPDSEQEPQLYLLSQSF